MKVSTELEEPLPERRLRLSDMFVLTLAVGVGLTLASHANSPDNSLGVQLLHYYIPFTLVVVSWVAGILVLRETSSLEIAALRGGRFAIVLYLASSLLGLFFAFPIYSFGHFAHWRERVFWGVIYSTGPPLSPTLVFFTALLAHRLLGDKSTAKRHTDFLDQLGYILFLLWTATTFSLGIFLAVA